MLNKNDPLIGAVQEVMKRNHAEREAARLVNEKFGVQDRKALPHEKQSAWDSAYKQVLSEGLHPNQQKLDVHEPEKDKLTKHDFKMLRAKKKTMEEAKVNPYAVGMAAVKKSTGDEPPMEKKNITKAHKIAKKIIAKRKVNEGFNNRHSLSENASAEKQAVAVLNEQENPIVAQRKKYAAKRKQAAADKKTTERIKAREPREPTSFERFQAREKQSPTKVIGGSPIVPIGGPAASLAKTAIRNAPGILSRAYNYFRGGSSSQQPTLAAGAARRPPGQTVPQIRQQSPSSGSNLPTGPWGSIARSPRRGGDARAAAGKDTRGAPSGTMMARLRQQGQQVQQGRAGGSTVAATQAASRTRLAQQTQQGRVGTNTTGATQTAARTSLAQRIKGMRAGGATAGARRVPQTAFANEVPGISTAPNAAQADSGPEKIKTSTQTTTTQPDYDKMTFGQAFKTARQQAGGAGGKFKYKGKEYQTNIKGTGTAKKPQEKYQPASKLKDVTPAPATKTSTSVVGGQGIAAVPGGTSSAAAKPVPSAAKERANFAGPPAGQNRQKDNSYLMSGAFPKMDTFRDKGKYAGDMRDTKGPAAAERLANPTFVPRPSPGTVRRNSTLAAPSAIAAKPASSPMASQGSSGTTQSKILPQRKSSGGGSGGGGGGGY